MTRARVTDRRRPGVSLGRRCALAAASGFVLLALAAQPARADTSAQLIEIAVTGPTAQGEHQTTVGELEAGCPEYAGASYVPGITFSQDTWALGSVLTCVLGSAATQVNEVVIHQSSTAGGGAEAPLDDDEIAGTAYPYGDPPVIETDGTVLNYYRPAQNAGDDAGRDYVVDAGEPLVLDAFTGPVLTVTAEADPMTVNAGATVSFSVSENDTGQPSFAWNFAGLAPNSTAADPTIQIAPDTIAGTYEVNVEVTDAGSGAAGDSEVTLTVDSDVPPPPASTTTTATTTEPPQTTTGSPTTPRRTHGPHHTTSTPTAGSSTTTSTTTPASRSSSTPTSSSPTRTAASRTTTSSSTTTDAAAAPTAPAEPPATATTSAATTTTTTTTSTTTTTTTTTSTTTPTVTVPAPTHTAPAASPGNPREPIVTGHLIANVIPLPAGRSPLVHAVPAAAADDGAASVAHATAASWPAIAGAAALILALLGLGAARELRGR